MMMMMGWWTLLLALTTLLAGLVGVCRASPSGFYADNALRGQTVLVDRLSQQSRRAVKQQILALLGLDHLPRPPSRSTHTSAPSSYMLDLYRTLQNEVAEDGTYDADWMYRIKQQLLGRNLTLAGMEDTAEKADVIVSFANHVRHNKAVLRHQRSRAFYFDLCEVPAQNLLTGAELRLYKYPSDVISTNVTVKIHRVVETRRGSMEYSLELEANTTVTADYEGWLELNITRAARYWSWYPDSNRGLLLELTDPDDEQVHSDDAGFVMSRGRQEKLPFMVAFFTANQEVHIRKAREAAANPSPKSSSRTSNDDVTTNESEAPGGYGGFFADEGYNRRTCQRRALYVSFKELGWQEWIIAPEGYPAFYCQGECSFPLNVHMNATNHAIVQTLVHLMNPIIVPKPNCAPTKLSAISVLYFDDNSNVILRKYRNMVVRACGCH